MAGSPCVGKISQHGVCTWSPSIYLSQDFVICHPRASRSMLPVYRIPMRDVVVSDASCFITYDLAKREEDISKFGQMWVTFPECINFFASFFLSEDFSVFFSTKDFAQSSIFCLCCMFAPYSLGCVSLLNQRLNPIFKFPKSPSLSFPTPNS